MLCHILALRKLLHHSKITHKVIISASCRDLMSATGDIVDLATTALVADGASKPPLVILHGLIISKEIYEGIGKDIHEATGRTVVIPDARNHGRSPHSPQHTFIHMANDTAELINKLGHPKVSVLGHSMGGRTAMALSLLRTDLISSLIVVDISPVNDTSDRMKAVISNALDAMSKTSFVSWSSMSEARSKVDEQLKRFIPSATARKYLLSSLVRDDSGVYKWASNLSALNNHLKGMLSFPRELNGYKYCGKSLFIAGSRSDYIGENGLEGIQRFFPTASLEIVENAGHDLPFQHQTRFVQIVSQFLAEN